MITHIRPQGRVMMADFGVNHWVGSILGHTTWSDTIRIFGDITVEEGAVLELEPGARVRFQPSDELRSGVDPDRIELIVRGTLRVRQGGRTTPTVFLGPSEEREPWYGIRLEGDSARVDMKSATMIGALYGISGKHTHADVALKHVSIKESVHDAIRLEEWEGKLELADAGLHNSGGHGITLSGSGMLSLVRSSVRKMAGAGIYLNGPTLKLSSSSVSDNASDGIYLTDWEGEAEITNSSIQHNQGMGIRAVGGHSLRVQKLRAKENTEGNIWVEETFLECALSNVSGIGDDEGFGLRAIRTSGSVTGTTFEDHEIAVWASSSPLTFSDNTLRNHTNALLCDVDPVPVFSPFNALWENLHSVRNTTSDTLRAENNWWGTPDPSEIPTQIEGNVQWRPFLVSDPTGKDHFVLNPNFPNPFNAYTALPFQVPMEKERFGDRVQVAVAIYDVSGQRVRMLLDRPLDPGYYAPIWDGRDELGHQTGSGIYVYRVTLYDTQGFEAYTESAKMVQIK